MKYLAIEHCELDIPVDAQTGTIVVLKGHGLYNRKTKRKGNLRINLKIDIPHLNNNNDVEDFIKRLKSDD